MAILPIVIGLGALFVLSRIFMYRRILSDVPNAHWSASILPGWILWTRFRCRENDELRKAHDQLGPVVRVAPEEISINLVEGGLKTVYGQFEKHQWYRGFYNLDRPNMFSTLDYATHSEKRKALTRVYSKSHVLHSPALRMQSEIIIYDRLNVILQSHARDGKPLEAFRTIMAITMDFVTAFLVGLANGTNLLRDEKQRHFLLDQYQSRNPYFFYILEMQSFWNFLQRFGLHMIPKSARDDRKAFDRWLVDITKAAIRDANKSIADGKGFDEKDDGATVVQALYRAVPEQVLCNDSAAEEATLMIASEVGDHSVAGHETTSLAMTYIIYEVCRAPDLQQQLHDEIAPLFRPAALKKELPDFAAVDELPFLHACILEALRMRPAVPGSLARVTPKEGATIGGVSVPGGTRVSARAWCLHFNPDVYPDPHVFKPHRWLNDDGSLKKTTEAPEMYQWWWAFGSGGRVCIGKHFALHEIKSVVGFLFASFEVRYVGSHDMEQIDGFAGYPKEANMMISLKVAE